ncbi:hypothetical protein [Porphyromonas sp. COT-108 OH2963]|uniref:hypothetical protein n=1 Tax=Porphyromonas sp. COT-108 OH2963 TaxID=1515614 RepID=UPI000561192F|nr:hypothetical protein [Porphyromonas sp. COT-108 OH2963]
MTSDGSLHLQVQAAIFISPQRQATCPTCGNPSGLLPTLFGENFRPHEILFPFAQKFSLFRTKIPSFSHKNFLLFGQKSPFFGTERFFLCADKNMLFSIKNIFHDDKKLFFHSQKYVFAPIKPRLLC